MNKHSSNEDLYLLLLLSIQLLPYCLGELIIVPDNEGECEGSVTLYEGSEETVVTKDEIVKKGGRGRSYFLGRRGEFSENIGWSKVRSVRRTECDRMAMQV